MSFCAVEHFHTIPTFYKWGYRGVCHRNNKQPYRKVQRIWMQAHEATFSLVKTKTALPPFFITAGLKEFSEGTDAVATYGSCEDKDRMSSAARWQGYNPYSGIRHTAA